MPRIMLLHAQPADCSSSPARAAFRTAGSCMSRNAEALTTPRLPGTMTGNRQAAGFLLDYQADAGAPTVNLEVPSCAAAAHDDRSRSGSSAGHSGASLMNASASCMSSGRAEQVGQRDDHAVDPGTVLVAITLAAGVGRVTARQQIGFLGGQPAAACRDVLSRLPGRGPRVRQPTSHGWNSRLHSSQSPTSIRCIRCNIAARADIPGRLPGGLVSGGPPRRRPGSTASAVRFRRPPEPSALRRGQGRARIPGPGRGRRWGSTRPRDRITTRMTNR